MSLMNAKFAGVCRGCGGAVQKGARIDWRRGDGAYHPGCAPTGNPAADREYLEGARGVERWRLNRAIYGEEAAEAMEIQEEMNDW